MLRRKPTSITLTTEDVAAYVLSRENNPHLHPEQSSTDGNGNLGGKEGVIDPNDELKPLPGDKARIVRTGMGRDERIGVGR
ncbi:hypothetical protein MMC16_000288 [Acarospora aff. strigata]|nr:hypothetical protein [Acarospora aff. strigata]